jgi:hypothetical protein
VIAVLVVIAVLIVIAITRLVAIAVTTVPISVPIAGLSVSPAPAVIGVMVVPPAVISIMIVPDNAVAEARVLAEARFVLTSPLPIFPLALTV